MKGPYVTKEFSFDCAHMLTGHEGLCKNLHGHTYKVEVTVGIVPDMPFTGAAPLIDAGPAEGMVVDFKELKEVLNKELFGKMDHAYIYNSRGGSAEKQIAELCESFGMRVFDMQVRPTAENMSQFFFNRIQTSLLPVIDGYLEVIRVKVWETPTSYAEVWKE